MVAAIGAVAGVAGAAISADGARSAANAQSGASEQANMMQAMAAAQQRADLAPWTQAGGAAQSRLNQYLGIGGVGSGGVTSMGLQTGLTPDQVRQQLMSRFTRTASGSGAPSGPQYRTGQEAVNALGAGGAAEYFQNRPQETPEARRNRLLGYAPEGSLTRQGSGDGNDGVHGDEWYMPGATQTGPGSEVDYEGLDAAIARYYEEQEAQNAAAAADPTYGSLLRPYRNGQEFSFTGEDLENDPGYQFGLNQGTQGIERGQAARGNFLSGAAMKELNRFNQDYAGTKFDNAFARNLNTWNTNLNAYTGNQDRIYNFLTGVSTLGQNSAARVGAGNQQAANQMSGNLLASGNAQAAGAIAGSNALQSGINQAANGINSAGGWNSLLGNSPSVYSAGGSAGAGWGSGAAFGNQDLGMNF